MQPLWTEVLEALLRPATPHLAQVRARAAVHLAAERVVADRDSSLADCQRRIELLRARVFEAGDGVVNGEMTSLEREWLTLRRAQPSSHARALALWDAIAPRRWAGRLRWSVAGDQSDVELAVALASDPDGVEQAEAQAVRLASCLASWGAPIPATCSWRLAPVDATCTAIEAILMAPLTMLTASVRAGYGGEALLERARRIEQDALAAARALPLLASREALAREFAHIAGAEFLWRASATEGRAVLGDGPNGGRRFDELDSPADALLALWKTGYVLVNADSDGVTLGVAGTDQPTS